MKKALITGITGQDGAYLAAFLLGKGYEVYGGYRHTATKSFWRLSELGILGQPALHLDEFDLCDLSSCIRIIEESEPDELYNLAAHSFASASFKQPIATAQLTGTGAVNILEAVRVVNKDIKFFQASASEMFGKVQNFPQSENTPFYPRSPYGAAKVFAHNMTVNYREAYDMFACCGILFNHESPLRSLEYVTRKITDGAAKIKLGLMSCLMLGNLDAKRDWGFAGEYVDGMWRMLQADAPDNYVLATNRSESVRDFVRLAFSEAGMSLEFSGDGAEETAIDTKTGKTVVRVDPKLYRPTEVDILIGNPAKAADRLGWSAKTRVDRLCSMMVSEDIKRNENGFSF